MIRQENFVISSQRQGKTVGSERLQSLDAIRGLAAFVVLLWHCYAVCGPETTKYLSAIAVTPLRVLLNGPGAVMLFFVLSGFVLARPYFNHLAQSYPAFALRRFCRIYIPFFVALAGAWVLYVNVPHETLSAFWMQGLWDNKNPLPVAVLLEQFAMTGVVTIPDFNLDGPSWSLVHELRLSLLFPILVTIMRKRMIGYCFAGGVFAATVVIESWGNYRSFIDDVADLPSSFLVTAYLMPCFLLGIVLAEHHTALVERLRSLPGTWRWLLWGAAFAVFYVSSGFTLRFLLSVASAMIILLTLSSDRAIALLGQAVPAWLGRISYSLYLVHVPILLATIQATNELLVSGVLTSFLVVCIGAVMSLMIATLFHRLVEVPAIALGKVLSSKIQTYLNSSMTK